VVTVHDAMMPPSLLNFRVAGWAAADLGAPGLCWVYFGQEVAAIRRGDERFVMS
jgi:hypothetical protein